MATGKMNSLVFNRLPGGDLNCWSQQRGRVSSLQILQRVMLSAHFQGRFER